MFQNESDTELLIFIHHMASCVIGLISPKKNKTYRIDLQYTAYEVCLKPPLWETSKIRMWCTVPPFKILYASLLLLLAAGGWDMNWICRSASQHKAIQQFKNWNVVLINAWGLHLWPLWNYSEVIFTSLSVYIFWLHAG